MVKLGVPDDSPPFDEIREYFTQRLCEVVSTKAMMPIIL